MSAPIKWKFRNYRSQVFAPHQKFSSESCFSGFGVKAEPDKAVEVGHDFMPGFIQVLYEVPKGNITLLVAVRLLYSLRKASVFRLEPGVNPSSYIPRLVWQRRQPKSFQSISTALTTILKSSELRESL